MPSRTSWSTILLAAFFVIAGIGLIVLLVAVFPANAEMLRLARDAGAPFFAQAALWLRLPIQPLLIWWVWRASLK